MRRTLAATAAIAAIAALSMGGQAATSGARTAPAGRVYVVRTGDTLTSIAARFGSTPSALARANGIRNPNVVVIGSKLTVPTVAGAAPRALGLPAKLLANPDRLALRPAFRQWAETYGVPSDLLEALCWVESGWQRAVVSNTGAVGVGQLQPATVDHMRLVLRAWQLDPLNPDDNIRMSARFLRFVLDGTGGDLNMALAAYYQGLRSVRTQPVLAETMRYVATVLAVRPMFR